MWENWLSLFFFAERFSSSFSAVGGGERLPLPGGPTLGPLSPRPKPPFLHFFPHAKMEWGPQRGEKVRGESSANKLITCLRRRKETQGIHSNFCTSLHQIPLRDVHLTSPSLI